MSSRAIKILITIAVVVGGAGILVYSSLADSEYYKKVHEVMVEPDVWADKNLRIHGWVEAGSIDEKIVGQKTKRTFILESKGHRVLVRNEGPKPDTFRDLAEVVAKGRFFKEGNIYVLDATELMAKCPSKYEGNSRTNAEDPAAGALPAGAPAGAPPATGAPSGSY